MRRRMDGDHRLRNIRSRLRNLRVPELKNILAKLNINRYGKKNELIERIAVALESFQDKIQDPSLNVATTRFYQDQLSSAMTALEEVSASNDYRHMRPHPAPYPPPYRYMDASSRGQTVPMTTPMPSRYASAPPPNAFAPQVPAYPPARYMTQMDHAVGLPTMPRPPLGIETFTPNISVTLNNARCFCTPVASSGKVVGCIMCERQVHAKCHQLDYVNDAAWVCETCRSKHYEPYYQVLGTVQDATFVQFSRADALYSLDFVISDTELTDMLSRRSANPSNMTPGTVDLQLRCFNMKGALSDGHCWPATTYVTINGFTMPIIQRAPPGHNNPSKVLRELPASLLNHVRQGKNTVEVRTNENPALFAFLVQKVTFRSAEELYEEVVSNSRDISYEQAKEEVVKSFGDDEDIVVTSTVLSVRCPLGLCVIEKPARGKQCRHLQCFDLKTFLQFSKKARSRAWRCAVCHKFVRATDLRIDPYLLRLLTEVKGEEELEEVEIYADATWKRRKEEEEQTRETERKVKSEVKEEKTSAGAGAGSSAGQPVEIDLLSSDTEDEEPVGGSASAPASVADSSTESGGVVDEDEVQLVRTVDNDSWDSLSNGFINTSQGNTGSGTSYELLDDESLLASIGVVNDSSRMVSSQAPQPIQAPNWSHVYAMPSGLGPAMPQYQPPVKRDEPALNPMDVISLLDSDSE